MAEKRRFSRRAYLSDFGRDASGAYIYTGACYAPADGDYKAFGLRLGIPAALAAAGTLAQGCIPAAGMKNTFYVLGPFLLEAVCVFSVFWGAARYFLNAKPLREYVYESTVKAIPLRALLAAVFAAACLIGETVCLLLRGEPGALPATVSFYALLLVVIGACLVLWRGLRRSRWTKTGEKG